MQFSPIILATMKQFDYNHGKHENQQAFSYTEGGTVNLMLPFWRAIWQNLGNYKWTNLLTNSVFPSTILMRAKAVTHSIDCYDDDNKKDKIINRGIIK